ncbi:hypothetical protein BDZ45DRAFT_682211 [Acephala macrosclerotiorum]|nr:hypothetical protein BDZ45DRAFT_682211 [Acephala macrosclerotiorum]
MHAFTNIIFTSGLIASISASPLLIARNTCGSAPSGSGSQTPLAQPTGIQTASACEAQCEANSACQSFVFGMANNAIECILYSVAAASVPSQGSGDLVVYDKACPSIPAVVPTSSNPTGAATSSSNTGSNAGNSANNGQNRKRSACGTTPTGTSSQAPLSTPAGITTAADCQSQCDANSACESFVFGMVNNADECILYPMAAASIPTQTSTNLVAYDKACASVPTQTPTASNPTGANTGSSSSSGSTGGNTGSNTGAGNGAAAPAKA